MKSEMQILRFYLVGQILQKQSRLWWGMLKIKVCAQKCTYYIQFFQLLYDSKEQSSSSGHSTAKHDFSLFGRLMIYLFSFIMFYTLVLYNAFIRKFMYGRSWDKGCCTEELSFRQYIWQHYSGRTIQITDIQYCACRSSGTSAVIINC